ncbi:photosystem I reaction center subunit N, chloroplastic [Artemisia annua]|uniref:Photosystem I reaction center subunit N, chloroplastic n=1 Tax=Artemisia annua TaxID=35608 RepID=A0A2U1PE67_ARTAN|nr:photosystem I reaction center subunit N, chloroplastic [Artemisia annua]
MTKGVSVNFSFAALGTSYSVWGHPQRGSVKWNIWAWGVRNSYKCTMCVYEDMLKVEKVYFFIRLTVDFTVLRYGETVISCSRFHCHRCDHIFCCSSSCKNNIVSDVFISGFSPSSCGSYKDEAQEQAKEETEELTNQKTDTQRVVLILGFLGLLNCMDLNFMNFAGFNFGVFGILQRTITNCNKLIQLTNTDSCIQTHIQKDLCAEKERDERRSGNRRMDHVSLELNDQKRLATSGRNFATTYTLQFGTCTFPYNFTGCQDLAKQKYRNKGLGAIWVKMEQIKCTNYHVEPTK